VGSRRRTEGTEEGVAVADRIETPRPGTRSPWTLATLGAALAILLGAATVAAYLLDARYATPPVAREIAREVCGRECQSREEAAARAWDVDTTTQSMQRELTDRLGRIETRQQAQAETLGRIESLLTTSRRPR